MSVSSDGITQRAPNIDKMSPEEMSTYIQYFQVRQKELAEEESLKPTTDNESENEVIMTYEPDKTNHQQDEDSEYEKPRKARKTPINPIIRHTEKLTRK